MEHKWTLGLKYDLGKKKIEWDNPHNQERKQHNYYTKHNLNLIQIKNTKSIKSSMDGTNDKELFGDRAIRNDLGSTSRTQIQFG